MGGKSPLRLIAPRLLVPEKFSREEPRVITGHTTLDLYDAPSAYVIFFSVLVSNLKHTLHKLLLDAVGGPTMPQNYTRKCHHCQVPAPLGLLVQAGDAVLDSLLTWVRLPGRQIRKTGSFDLMEAPRSM